MDVTVVWIAYLEGTVEVCLTKAEHYRVLLATIGGGNLCFSAGPGPNHGPEREGMGNSHLLLRISNASVGGDGTREEMTIAGDAKGVGSRRREIGRHPIRSRPG